MKGLRCRPILTVQVAYTNLFGLSTGTVLLLAYVLHNSNQITARLRYLQGSGVL